MSIGYETLGEVPDDDGVQQCRLEGVLRRVVPLIARSGFPTVVRRGEASGGV